MLVERYERIMGTRVGAQVDAPPAEADAARAAIDACLTWMREVDRRLTRFTLTSDLSRLNAAKGHWARVSAMLYEVVERALRAAEETDGLFDPTILPILEAWGYDRDFSAIAFREAALEWSVPNDLIPPGHWREIALDRERRRIRMPAGMRLDLGGIAKGWAADVALERFFGAFPNVLVDVGGDMRARGGPEDGELWPLGISAGGALRAPRSGEREGSLNAPPEQSVVVTLGQGGVATSGARERWWLRSGLRAHHLIDPRAARPARLWIDRADNQPDGRPLIASATAFAASAERAEVATKAAILRGFPAALEVVEAAAEAEPESEGAIALLLTLGTGGVAFSSNLPAYLARKGAGGDIWIT